MKYLLSDYALLNGISPKDTCSLGSAYTNMCYHMSIPVSMPCLLYTLRGLTAGGYVLLEPENGVISVSTPISLTEAGRKAVTVSGLQKLLGAEKAAWKKEQSFCESARPEVTPGEEWTVDPEGFEAIVKNLHERRELELPLFELTEVGDGMAKLTVHHPNDSFRGDGDEDNTDGYDPDAAAVSYSACVTGPGELVAQGMRDLIAAAHALVTEPPRTRKVALHGSDRSLLISLAHAANERGVVSLRMTLSQIRFNRQRFVGKRDSELDYAQCGDPIFILEMASAGDFARYGVMQNALNSPHLLGTEDFDALSEIHRKTC